MRVQGDHPPAGAGGGAPAVGAGVAWASAAGADTGAAQPASIRAHIIAASIFFTGCLHGPWRCSLSPHTEFILLQNIIYVFFSFSFPTGKEIRKEAKEKEKRNGKG